MNRAKKEEIRKYNEARQGLTPEEVQALNAQEEKDRLIEKIARAWHSRQYPEEYDFMMDSRVDAAERSRGINPMRAEYIARVNEKRKQQGVSPLSESGLARSQETMTLCLEKVRENFDNIYTRVDEVLFYKWDPLRLSNSNTVRDEYSGYVNKVIDVVLEASSPRPLATHLEYLATSFMGVDGSEQRDSDIATLIFAIVHDQDYFPDHEIIKVD